MPAVSVNSFVPGDRDRSGIRVRCDALTAAFIAAVRN